MYASNDERVDGGGCLDLVNMVAEELGLEEGSLTGTWDFAHQLQVSYHNNHPYHYHPYYPHIKVLFNKGGLNKNKYQTLS